MLLLDFSVRALAGLLPSVFFVFLPALTTTENSATIASIFASAGLVSTVLKFGLDQTLTVLNLELPDVAAVIRRRQLLFVVAILFQFVIYLFLALIVLTASGFDLLDQSNYLPLLALAFAIGVNSCLYAHQVVHGRKLQAVLTAFVVPYVVMLLSVPIFDQFYMIGTLAFLLPFVMAAISIRDVNRVNGESSIQQSLEIIRSKKWMMIDIYFLSILSSLITNLPVIVLNWIGSHEDVLYFAIFARVLGALLFTTAIIISIFPRELRDSLRSKGVLLRLFLLVFGFTITFIPAGLFLTRYFGPVIWALLIEYSKSFFYILAAIPFIALGNIAGALMTFTQRTRPLKAMVIVTATLVASIGVTANFLTLWVPLWVYFSLNYVTFLLLESAMKVTYTVMQRVSMSEFRTRVDSSYRCD